MKDVEIVKIIKNLYNTYPNSISIKNVIYHFDVYLIDNNRICFYYALSNNNYDNKISYTDTVISKKTNLENVYFEVVDFLLHLKLKKITNLTETFYNHYNIHLPKIFKKLSTNSYYITDLTYFYRDKKAIVKFLHLNELEFSNDFNIHNTTTPIQILSEKTLILKEQIENDSDLEIIL